MLTVKGGYPKQFSYHIAFALLSKYIMYCVYCAYVPFNEQ